MKQNQKYKIISAFLIIPVTIFSLFPFTFQPLTAQAAIFTIPKGEFAPFGGNLVEKNLRFCLRSLPFFPYILPIPFYVILVYLPSPAGLYWLFGISQLYLEYEFEKSANTLGNYAVGADNAWREFCDINGKTLPKSISGKTWTGVPWKMPVTGVAWKMGTSCRVNPKYINDGCHKRVIKRELKGVASLAAEIAAILAATALLQSQLQKQFNISNEDFAGNCDQYSPAGNCYPIGTCDQQASANAGSCVTAGGTAP